MANAYKILGQSAPAAATLTDLYTVPGAKSAICSSLVICNQSATPTTFRVAVGPAAAAPPTAAHYLYYDVAIAGNDTFTATLGITLEAAKVMSVYATLATLSFNLFGQEIT